MLVSDIIYAAYRLCGRLGGPGRSVSPEETSDGLAALNSILDSWATERLIVYAIERNSYNLVAGQQVYHIGPSQEWNTGSNPRPVKIERASQWVTTNAAMPWENPLLIYDFKQWQAIPVKSISSTLVQVIYPDYDYPNGHINVYPVPQVATNPIILYVWKAVPQFASASVTVSLPPGYGKAIITNLAVDLTAYFPGLKISPALFQQAAEAKGAIKRANIRPIRQSCDPAILPSGGAPFNIFSGEYSPR